MGLVVLMLVDWMQSISDPRIDPSYDGWDEYP
jgi:hypothetical protein